MHGKKEVPYDINVCFVDGKHKAKCLKRTLTRFKLLHQFDSNPKLWQVYMDEARPQVLNKLIVSSPLKINFLGKVAHQDAFVFMDNFESHCCVSYVNTNTFGFEVKKGNSTL